MLFMTRMVLWNVAAAWPRPWSTTKELAGLRQRLSPEFPLPSRLRHRLSAAVLFLFRVPLFGSHNSSCRPPLGFPPPA